MSRVSVLIRVDSGAGHDQSERETMAVDSDLDANRAFLESMLSEPPIGVPQRFVIAGLKATRRDGALWIEGLDGAFVDLACVDLTAVFEVNADDGGYVIAAGSRAMLEYADAPLKFVTKADDQ